MLISLVNASKDFGIKNLFKNLDLHINKKERLGLIGLSLLNLKKQEIMYKELSKM